MKIRLFLFAWLGYFPVQAYTASGLLTADETWADTVTVTGDIVVDSAVLTILPGTAVRFSETSDNIVEGNTGQIFLVVQQKGSLQAVGTIDQPILFTTVSDTPQPGSWGQLHFIALKNDPPTVLKYCIFEYDRAGIGMRNDAGLPEVSAPVIDHCIFGHFTNSGVYGTSGCAATVTNCVFHDIQSAGIFLHGANTVVVRNCYFYNLSTGIINANITGGNYTQQHLILDHITIYNVDMMLSASPQWWTGYAIYNTNAPLCSLTVTNSIISSATLAGMRINGWNVKENNNCWFPGPMGLATIEDGTPDSTSLEEDPQFRWTPGNDFRLADGSPCKGAAGDGSNMGAWQETDEWPPFGLEVGREDITFLAGQRPGLACYPNPFSIELNIILPDLQHTGVVRICDIQGTVLYEYKNTCNARSIKWDGKDGRGASVKAGLYFCSYRTPGQEKVQSLIFR